MIHLPKDISQVVEVPVIGDTLPGAQQRTSVDLPVVRREAPPEVTTEVVQGPPLPAEYVRGLHTGAQGGSQSFAPPPGAGDVMRDVVVCKILYIYIYT